MKTRYSSGGVSAQRLIVGAFAAVFAITPAFATASTIDITYFTGSGCSGSASGGAPAFFGCGNASGSTAVSAEADLDTLKLNLASTFSFVDFASTTLRIQDMVTVSGGTGAGSITFDWVFDGTLEASDTYYSDVYFGNLGGSFADFRACGDNVPFASSICVADLYGPQTPATDTTTVTNQTRSITIPFTFDVPFAVDWRLTAVIADGCTFGNSCFGGIPRPGSGDVQFGNTLQLAPLTVLDANGSQVGSAIVASDSGARYAVASVPSAVPEPSMLVLLSGGLLTALRVRRRR